MEKVKARKVAKKAKEGEAEKVRRVYLSIFGREKKIWPKYVTLVEPEQGLIMMKNAQNDAVEKQQKAKKKKGSSGVLSISGGYIGGYGEGDDGLIDFTSWRS